MHYLHIKYKLHQLFNCTVFKWQHFGQESSTNWSILITLQTPILNTYLIIVLNVLENKLACPLVQGQKYVNIVTMYCINKVETKYT